MPNRQYSHVVIAVCAALCLVTQLKICKASPVAIKGILEFHINVELVNLPNSSAYNYTSVVTEIETKVRVNLTQALRLEDLTIRIRQTDGLCQVYFIIHGDAQLVSAWLVLWAHLQIVIHNTSSEVDVLFESKGRRYKVATDQVCDVRQVIQPCEDTEQCSVDGCIPRQQQGVANGILIVLGYAAAFILALVLIILFCFYRV
ncbi:unnamed protein product, partial [Candidula unifasciata]